MLNARLPTAVIHPAPLDNLVVSRRMLLPMFERSTMTDRSGPLVQGTLDMLILKTLALEPLHGYGIGIRIEQISNGVFQVNAGSLFPALRRLERDGLLNTEWRASENNRRAKYYSLSAAGRRRLKAETRDWEVQTAAIARILRATPEEI
jgi:PadR family transcriptional regulator, regulatory protein PadR